MEYCILDIETTGLDREHSSIIEIGGLKIANGKVKDRFQSFVRYEGVIPLFVKRLTGIVEEDVANAPLPKEVIQKLQAFIGTVPVVAHNGFSFDFPFLERYGLVIKEKYDSLDFAFFVLPISPEGHSVKVLLTRFGLDIEKHRALADCDSTFNVIAQLQKKFEKRGKKQREALQHIALEIQWWWAQFLKVSPRAIESVGELVSPFEAYKKKNPDEQGLGMKKAIDNSVIQGYFSASKEENSDYGEERLEQKQMAELITRGFNESKHVIVEAGTGTGKSKAYLVPAAVFALQTGIPVIVSTHTKILQDQLFQKEVDHLKKIINPDLQVAILKGKQNYVCLDKLQSFATKARAILSLVPLYDFAGTRVRYSDKLASLLLISWAVETKRGDWNELPYWVKESMDKKVEGEICNKDELCNSGMCDLFDENKCFLAKAKLRAKDSDIVIVNHAVALSGIIVEESEADPGLAAEGEGDKKEFKYSHTLFPGDAKFIIFDEGHHLEDDATSAWSYEISRYSLSLLQEQLYGPKGAVNIIRPAQNDTTSPLNVLHDQFVGIKDKMVSINDSLFTRILPYLLTKSRGADAKELSIDSVLENSDDFKQAFQLMRDLKDNLVNASKILNKGIEYVRAPKLGRILETRIKQIGRTLESLDAVTSGDKKYVRYLEKGPGGDISVIAAPLSVAESLKSYVYDNFSTVVVTSATLTVDNRFKFIGERTGLTLIDKPKLIGKIFSSSFKYEDQVALFVPRGIVYDRGRAEDHFQKSVDFLEKAIVASNGGSLVLCSSHDQVDLLYKNLNEKMAAQNILLLRQEKNGSSIGSLVANFKEDINSALIGTQSLWEGIDVPGDSLRSLFIFKIPFPPPGRPLIKAREEEIVNRGGHGYYDYTEPLATLELKQGFGRLIRKATDIGIAVILDERLLKKPKIIASLPKGVVPQHVESEFVYSELSKLAIRSQRAESTPQNISKLGLGLVSFPDKSEVP